MAADDLYHFPTPSQAFGVRPAKQRPNPPLQQQQPQQQQRQQPRNDLPPLNQSQSVPQHPRVPQPSQYQQPQQRAPSHHSSQQNLRQAQPPLQQQQQYSQPSSPAIRVASRSTSQPLDSQSIHSGYSGYAPSAYSQLPQPPHQQAQPSPPRADPAQTLERQLRDLFDRVDRNRDGRLTGDELATALLNNDGTKFQQSTVRLMIRLFDTDDSSTIEFKEFYHLWNYILHWRKTFQRFDINSNHKISFGEYQAALESFGYRLPTDIVLFVFQKFGDFNANKPMSLGFDKFVESLVWLLRCTNIFKKFDSQGNGIATIPFQDFVHEVLSFI